MYAEYFGLTERPFSLAPDPRYLYLSDAHREALAHLLYGIGEGGSFVQLTGEVGTGKTTVCRALLEQLPPEVDVAMIFNPRLTSVELLAAVCDELRVQYPPGTTSLKVLVDTLSQALLDAHARGRRTVRIIAEAQNLRARVLEEVRLLTNLETTTQKLLQVVLIGQPELADLLSRRNLRQLSQRVTARYHLRSFSEAESQRYVQHRMEVAGQRQPIFTRQALRAAHRLSRGIPRLLNTICDRALLGAYATGQTRVKEAVVRRAAGLRCLIRTGTWTVLRRLNLPAILELATGDGRKYHVVLASLDGERATIEIGPRRVTLPSSEVERFWDGPFVLIWRSPVTGPVPLQPGMLGRDVAWLRQRLGALDGQPVTAKVNQTYDEELKRRVASFQQGEALVPDGIAGEETLVRLVATTPGANGPSLNRERP